MDKARLRRENKEQDQLLKDISYARCQREHHRRVQEYMNENPQPHPSRMLLRDGQFPLLNQDVDLTSPGLGPGNNLEEAVVSGARSRAVAATMITGQRRVGHALLPSNRTPRAAGRRKPLCDRVGSP